MTSDYPPPVGTRNPILRQREQRNLGIGLLVIVLIFAPIVLYRHFQDDRPTAQVGNLVVAADPVPVDTHRTVLVPGVSIDVGVTGDLDDVPGDVAARREQAPDGGSFIGVRVTGRRTVMPPVFGDGTAAGGDGVHLTLVAGSHSYPLTAEDSSDDSDLPVAGYLPVKGAPSTVSVEATWGGRSQTVDLRTGKRDAGDFAFLYQHHSTKTTSCDSGTLPAGWSADATAGGAASCHYQAVRYGYVYGHGWAARGKSWLVTTLSLSAPTVVSRTIAGANVEYFLYGPGDDQPTVRFGGARAFDSTSLPDSAQQTNTVVELLEVPVGSTTHAFTATTQSYYVARVTPARAGYDGYVNTSWSGTIRG